MGTAADALAKYMRERDPNAIHFSDEINTQIDAEAQKAREQSATAARVQQGYQNLNEMQDAVRAASKDLKAKRK